MARDLTELRNQDVFDSRDILTRIEELEDIDPDATDASFDRESWEEELAALRAFAEEARGYAADFDYGEGFIRDSYFVEYAQELAEDIGAIDREYTWPASHIDWQAAAEALQQDYSAVELDGITFWTR